MIFLGFIFILKEGCKQAKKDEAKKARKSKKGTRAPKGYDFTHEDPELVWIN